MRGTGLTAAGISALLMGGCASTAPQRYADVNYQGPSVDRLFRNEGVEKIRERTNHAYDASDARQLAAYDGINGARAAHLVFSADAAEKLDGACEPTVEAAQGETLSDIAALCDVSFVALLDANPDIDNPDGLTAGRLVHVPGAVDPQRVALVAAYLAGGAAPAHAGQSVQPTTFYIAQAGDTLEKIADIHRVSEARVATLNPGVDWSALEPGVEVRLPANGPVVPAAAAKSVSTAKPPAHRHDAPLSDDVEGNDQSDDVWSDDITKVMPYRLKPVRGANSAAFTPEGAGLTVDRTVAKRGEELTLSADHLPPNARVVISAGANQHRLTPIGAARTDANGALTTKVAVPGTADAGGVVYQATVEANGATLNSDRVSVKTVGK